MAAILRRRASRGLSLRALAEETGIPLGTLAWWSWRLRQDAARDEANEFVEIHVADVEAECSSRSPIRVELGDDICVAVDSGVDLDLLRQVVAALRSC
jgi:hypothetical protein